MTILQALQGEGPPRRRVALATKRLFDVLVSTCALLVFSPVGAGVAIVVWASMGRPILFRQERLGYRGRRFRLFKFRTMTEDRDEEGRLLPDHARMTWVGRFLRRTTLDELPELVNVLVGDMSIVGPRPLLVEYASLYDERQNRRHQMPPGMAGPVVAAGRNAIGWEEKFELDLAYVEDWSLLLDMKVLLRATWRILTLGGVAAQGHATMPRFEGTSHSSRGGRSESGEAQREHHIKPFWRRS